MAKLSVKLIIFLFCFQFLKAQDSLCVYKYKGTLLCETAGKLSPIKKGALISKTDLVRVSPQSEFTAIDQSGNTYNVNVVGNYSFKDLLNFKIQHKTANFTASYFKYIWEELTNSGEKKALIAGVIRGDLLMTFPNDSSKIAGSKITLKWQTLDDIKLYYIFLRNIETDELLKIETNGSQLALYKENPFFNEDTSFKWAVSTDAFPNLENIPFFSFELIDRNTYEAEKKVYKEFISDLKNINLTEKEIETILCETYRLCK